MDRKGSILPEAEVSWGLSSLALLRKMERTKSWPRQQQGLCGITPRDSLYSSPYEKYHIYGARASPYLFLVSLCVSVAQSCLTLCDPMDCSLPGPSVHGILRARILEWVAMLFCRGSSWPKDQTQVSCTADRFFPSWVTCISLPLKQKLLRPFLAG